MPLDIHAVNELKANDGCKNSQKMHLKTLNSPKCCQLFTLARNWGLPVSSQDG